VELLIGYLISPIAGCMLELIISGLRADRTAFLILEGASICDTGVDAHVVHYGFDPSEICYKLLGLIVARHVYVWEMVYYPGANCLISGF
jgi:hypothetical protein